MQMQVARQGSMAEQQMHQQQLKALHDDLQAVRVNTCRPGLVNTFTPCSKECAYVEVAAATFLSSCALPLLPFTNYTLILWFICHLATHATIVHSQSMCMHDQMLRYGTSFEHIWCSFDPVLPYAIQWIISCTVVVCVLMQEQYSADAESWSSQQAALQADLAALAAQTALKSLALDAMMRNSSRAGQGPGGHAIGGPLWQQVVLSAFCTKPAASKSWTVAAAHSQSIFCSWQALLFIHVCPCLLSGYEA